MKLHEIQEIERHTLRPNTKSMIFAEVIEEEIEESMEHKIKKNIKKQGKERISFIVWLYYFLKYNLFFYKAYPIF